jgi:hypothetical protein
MKKGLYLGIVILFLFAVCYFFASPYIAIYNIRNAALSMDEKTFNQYIDYSQVRDSFKEQINIQINNNLAHQSVSSLVFKNVATSIANKFVDNIVTPDNIMTIMKYSKEIKEEKQPDQAHASPIQIEKNKRPFSFDGRYSGINRFYIDIADTNNVQRKAHVELNRYGLLQWKIVSIRLNLNKDIMNLSE